MSGTTWSGGFPDVRDGLRVDVGKGARGLRGTQGHERRPVKLLWQQKFRLGGPGPLPDGTVIYSSFHKEAALRKPIRSCSRKGEGMSDNPDNVQGRGTGRPQFNWLSVHSVLCFK